MKKLLFPSLLILTLTGCPTTPTDDSAVNDDGMKDGSKVATVNTGRPDGRALSDRGIGLSQESVYFDYDSYIIRSEGRPVVDAHARHLSQQPARKVTIQGNADERGSREYNLALGQKRAEAVRQALRRQGVNDSQMEAVSLGKEHPRCTASTEECYAQNRRGDFVYLR